MIDRREYIELQKRECGRKVVGVLPALYPREIFTALGVLGVEIWGPPGRPAGTGASLVQSGFCPIVRNALAFIEAGKADVVDGLLFPNTCDSIKGLATLVADWSRWTRPVFKFQHPREPKRPEAIAYLRDELLSLIEAVEKSFGIRMEKDRLEDAIRLHAEAEALEIELLEERRRFEGTDRQLYELLRLGEFLHVEDHLPLLKEAVSKLSAEPVNHGVRVLVTGYVPEPMEIFDAINSAGAFVVADDYAAVSRRIPRRAAGLSGNGGGMEAIVSRYLALPPCPTRVSDPDERVEHLVSLARRSSAEAVVIHEVKFCEPELFDVPSLRRAFEAAGLPVLFFETELERRLSSRNVTMIEAFVEMMKVRRRREG